MTLLIRATTFALGLVFCTTAYAEDKIGVVAPISGTFSRLGNQLVDGAAIAIASDKSGQGASIVTADDTCTATGGAEAAKQLLQSDVLIVVGFLCTEALEAALPILGQKGIAIITPAIRSQTLTELRTDQRYPVFRLAPSNRNEVNETSAILSDRWRSTPFAIIDDGTIFGRELTSGIRARLEEKGLKPVFSDTYRPGLDNQNALVGRLKRAGATQVFVGGERDDVAAIGRSAAILDYPLTIIGSEALNALGHENDLAVGTLMIAPRAPQTLESARAAKNAIELAGKVPEGYTIAAYAAGEVALDVLQAAKSQAGSINELLRKTTFETALGPVQFDAAGERIADTYRLQKYDGKQFVPETN
ncbi:branched-chain amino acid transport system substrate-binding protein [Phyllobacterium ifriqiyense]|uniref:Branched-chain amino acid transport system substrate-binding protein n=1 Tax=Phyllobacterium ifriqiyense TaxID=314238 RepID=A0ABU0SF43_9HYPH|nr:branched-chain amino acid ABC transporter substrate-binding protein [Phyllobacterium ifriqiyense]MDQ0999392.1 branched-chain amino acid transport system substrate-binding protein [Phyllobacterium ifriqiyense]